MLLDTCVVIDLLRGKEAALRFVTGIRDRPSLSVITAAEIVASARNTREREQIDRVLQSYRLHDIELEIARLAGELVRRYGPSHSVDPIEALIAATATVSGEDLATLNLRHLPMFKALKRPYAG
jgi:predicted nucleic acid-binding protein